MKYHVNVTTGTDRVNGKFVGRVGRLVFDSFDEATATVNELRDSLGMDVNLTDSDGGTYTLNKTDWSAEYVKDIPCSHDETHICSDCVDVDAS